MRVGMPIYPQVDLLDVAGPWEMLSWAKFDITNHRATTRPHRMPRRFPDRSRHELRRRTAVRHSLGSRGRVRIVEHAHGQSRVSRLSH